MAIDKDNSTTPITQARLKELLEYDPDTGVFTRRVSSGNATAGSVAGRSLPSGHIQIGLDGRRYYAHRLAWLYVYGNWPSAEIDHVNRSPADNRLSNLREATRHENGAKRSIFNNNTSGVKGVYWEAAYGKWHARIRVNGELRSLGRFVSLDEAAAAYAAAARQCFGDFANPSAKEARHG